MSCIAFKDMPSQQPVVSVVILTYKRQDELLRSLKSVYAANCDSLEIIVVNNNPDDTGDLLAKEFPSVRYIDTGGNIGCEARNIGVAAASAEIVVTIDNDVNLKDSHFPEKLRIFFSLHPAAGCVNFKVLNPDGRLSMRDWCHPRDFGAWSDQAFLTDHISEGASAFRKEAFKAAGGYYAPFFIGHEGPDLSFRLMKAGFEVWYSPDVQVLHFASTDARPSWRAYYYNTRNNIWLAYRHFPVGYAIRYIFFYSLMMFAYAVKAGHLGAFFIGVRDGLMNRSVMGRVPLGKLQMGELGKIYAHRPSFMSKIFKHLSSKQSYR